MKWIKRLVVGSVLLVVMVYLSIMFLLGPAINKAAGALGPEVLGAEVEVQDVDVSPFLNACTVQGVKIGNPKCKDDKAWKSEYAFKMDELSVSYVLGSVTSDQIIIEEIVIDGAEVMYETSALSFQGMPASSNLEHLKMNIDELVGPPKGEEPKEDEKPGKKIWIKKFIFKNAKMHIKSTALGGAGVPLPIPDIEIDDIGKESEGKSIGETVASIYDKLLPELLNVVGRAGALIKDGVGGAVDGVKDVGEGIIDGVKGLF